MSPCDTLPAGSSSSLFPLAFRPGGDKENRTPDPLLAKQVLSQLSYTPAVGFRFSPLYPFVKIPEVFRPMDLQN